MEEKKELGWCRRSGRIFPVSPCGWGVSPVAVRVMRNRGLTGRSGDEKISLWDAGRSL